MRAATHMAEKRPFQMYTERPGSSAARAIFPQRSLNRIGQAFESRTDLIERHGHCSRKITGDAVSRKQLLHCRQARRIGKHHVVTRASVNMNVHEPRPHNSMTLA